MVNNKRQKKILKACMREYEKLVVKKSKELLEYKTKLRYYESLWDIYDKCYKKCNKELEYLQNELTQTINKLSKIQDIEFLNELNKSKMKEDLENDK